jgi:prolyl-tRNA synthetase
LLHHDGQKFAEAYDIKFKDKDGKEKYVWQNTHAITTRMLGGMLAMHSDNNGLVIPPRIARYKVAIIPLLFKGKEEPVLKAAEELKEKLKELNPILDDRDDLTPGRKFADHELKGTPIRIEIGPRDLEKNEAIVKTRIGEEKLTIKIEELKTELPKLLEEMQQKLFNNAKKVLEENTKKTESKEELISFIKEGKLVKVPLKDSGEVEEALKHETGGAKALFLDHEDESTEGKKCIITGEDADYWIYTGKTY